MCWVVSNLTPGKVDDMECAKNIAFVFNTTTLFVRWSFWGDVYRLIRLSQAAESKAWTLSINNEPSPSLTYDRHMNNEPSPSSLLNVFADGGLQSHTYCNVA